MSKVGECILHDSEVVDCLFPEMICHTLKGMGMPFLGLFYLRLDSEYSYKMIYLPGEGVTKYTWEHQSIHKIKQQPYW